jgi:hypothetical protein
MTWQVEQATEPSHAPKVLIIYWRGRVRVERTFKVYVILVRYAEKIVSFVPFDGLDQAALGIRKIHFDSET